MAWLLRFVGIWSIADAAFLLLAPRRWSRWWGRWIAMIGNNRPASLLFALLELAMGVYLICRSLAGDAGNGSNANNSSVARAGRAAVGIEKSRLLTALFRAPIPLYRLGLGWLFGHRFLMLTHRGRKSGRPYQTVLEVVHYDPATDESIVVSGWGTRADWYRNIRANPPIAVAIGHERYQPTYRELAPDEIYPIINGYLQKSPPIYRGIVERTLFGEGVTEEAMRERARSFVMVAFRPANVQAARQTG